MYLSLSLSPATRQWFHFYVVIKILIFCKFLYKYDNFAIKWTESNSESHYQYIFLRRFIFFVRLTHAPILCCYLVEGSVSHKQQSSSTILKTISFKNPEFFRLNRWVFSILNYLHCILIIIYIILYILYYILVLLGNYYFIKYNLFVERTWIWLCHEKNQ